MHRLPVKSSIHKNISVRLKSSSNFIRSTFIEYFKENHGHKHVKSSSVVPLYDSTVPFVNAGMNQFKGVFLEKVDPPCPRAVNSQKCIRVGGKHNDLDVVGTDGTHHTFFEMLGNWSFGDYYKKEACQMAWDLLLGPYRLKPENLLVTYFSGDVIIGLEEDRECRDIWKAIGVPSSRLKAMGAAENFWEMGITGPCGPCTEIHYVNSDGTLTEIWNLVFIQCNRESDGSVKGLRRHHVDTGMGLERMTALLQNVRSNYDTDLFRPLIAAIEKNSKGVDTYGGSYDKGAVQDCAYRRLADHARMVSICLADGVFPATSLNLKQIMRKTFKMSSDIFNNPDLLPLLYNEVISTLGSTYPELISKEADAKLIMEHERQTYDKMKGEMVKKWKELVKIHPEVEGMLDVELAGFPQGYKEFKDTMSKQKSSLMPGELVFKLYDTHGFQEDVIQRIADLNRYTIDKEGFWKLLSKHRQRHKTSFKEQTANRGSLFNKTIDNLIKGGVKRTNDDFKYNYSVIDNRIVFENLNSKLIAILNEDCECLDFLEVCENRPYYLVTESTSFYCEEGGQISDTGIIQLNKNVMLKVDSVFKIRDFVFHKGYFQVNGEENIYVKCDSDVTLIIDNEKRLNLMKNHSAVHLLNAAIRKVLPNSVVCQIGSSVTDRGLSLNLSVYGEKLSQKVLLDAQDLIRKSIEANAQIFTTIMDSVHLANEESVTMIPGETYPEQGLRLVTAETPLLSKELCCGTHVPSTGHIGDFCVTLVKGAGGHTPTIHALTGDAAKEARELFCRAKRLEEVIDLVDPDRRKEEVVEMRRALAELCGTSGAPYGEYADCLKLLEGLLKRPIDRNAMALHAIAETEVNEVVGQALREGRRFVVHFLRCSYLMQGDGVAQVLEKCTQPTPALLMGCAGGVVIAACRVPEELVTNAFTANQWLSCILPVFQADALPSKAGESPLTYAEMTATKVSLINCEQLVQDAMRIAIKFAQSHTRNAQPHGHDENTQNRQQN
ncbi:hypothetical protein K1T71_010618 [Dendrolimus kikuchii]|uniref:Uncharacterized protein n=1 Tax=Dendrolimus kikuchii TaxID=765133 RepID=A0ACC1CPY9_9NEOP|nr:hypothetical protein K1T71_010618 [Dendrolimus kikuchii]